MAKKTNLLAFKNKTAYVDNLTLFEDGNFVDYYCVKIGDTIFSNSNNEYKFTDLQDALNAQTEIGKLVKDKIKEIERAKNSA